MKTITSNILAWQEADPGDWQTFLSGYFTDFPLTEHIATIQNLLIFAELPEAYTGRSPGDVLYDIEQLRRLIEFAHLVYAQASGGTKPLGPAGIAWRSVVASFFDFQTKEKWLTDLRELFDWVFSCQEYDGAHSILNLYLHLTRLVEAMHSLYESASLLAGSENTLRTPDK